MTLYKVQHLLLAVCLFFLVPSCTQPTRSVRESSNGLTPYLLQNINYPPEALSQRVGGVVEASIIVNKTGGIDSIKILSSPHPLLSEAVKKSVRQTPINIVTSEYQLRILFLPNNNITEFIKNDFEAVILGACDPPDTSLLRLKVNFSYKDCQDLDIYPPVDKYPIYDDSKLMRQIRFPKESREREVEEKIVVRLYLNKQSCVQKMFVDQGEDPTLYKEVMRTLIETNFLAAEHNGIPVDVWFSMTVNFLLK